LAYRELDDMLRLTDTGADTLAHARTGKWPDVPADRALYDALETGDYAKWHAYKTDQIEESGQHQVLNGFCFLGAMEALGPQAGQGGVSRKLGLCVTGDLRALPRLVAELLAVRRSTCPRSTT
jgi:hypothetical protein